MITILSNGRLMSYFSKGKHVIFSYLDNFQGTPPFQRLLSARNSTGQLQYNKIQSDGTSTNYNILAPAKNNSLTAAFLVKPDFKNFYEDIREALHDTHEEEREIAQYYFNGEGKAVRPVIILCMASAINNHLQQTSPIVIEKQKKLAQICEMFHTASLIHDDVIDGANRRRNKPSVNILWGEKKAIIAAVYIMGIATRMLASLENEKSIVLLSKVMADLVQGEFMQLPSRENEDEKFAHYIEKTFKKTGSLIAYGCQTVAVVAGADSKLQTIAFEYGRQLGIAFQLVDDLLDFIATSSQLGKPAATDLRLGLATAPVLFAAQEFPELNPLILRRFKEPGDVETSFQLVLRSEGLQRTKELARQYCNDAVRQITQIAPSIYQQGLVKITDEILNRMK